MVEHSNTNNDLKISYNYIKNIICDIQWTSENIKLLAEVFSKEINSKRRQSTIVTIKELISVLEDRCVIDPTDIKIFFIIEKKANNERLSTVITSHQNLLLEYNKECQQSKTKIDVSTIKEFCPYLPVKIPKQVMLLLCQEIRNSWRDFARHLQLCEGDIDNIESIYSNHYERVSQVLIIFEKTALFLAYKDIILNSLKKIRRTDLMEKVALIFSES